MKIIIILNVQYYLCIFIIISLFPHKSLCDDPKYETCVPKICGNVTIKFPFIIEGDQQSYCGYPGFNLTCKNNDYPVLEISSDAYRVNEISYETSSIRVANVALWPSETSNKKCDLPQIRNLTLQGDQFVHSNDLSIALLTNCSGYLTDQLYKYMVACEEGNVSNVGLVMNPDVANFSDGFRMCNVVTVVPVLDDGYVNRSGGYNDYVEVLREGFDLNWKASDCTDCEDSGGRCGFEAESFAFKCYCTDRPHSRTCKPTTPTVTHHTAGGKDAGSGSMKLILATAIPGAVLVFFLVPIIIIWKRKKRNKLSTYFIPTRTLSDVEDGSSYYGMPVFSYNELEEATHNFDPSKELGDGGFGTVYHGILRDGREVAVKRLYENNYKQVELFMNEIHILTRLHHRNLVQLYGSTSHRSPKLLLVYEYIPNGTVADHLHGEKAQTKPLTWPVRMNIAIETASALSYLHKSDIIHRDVKTNNILLDNHFCVKVADFGLSRLFPNDVSHVSTAPQGTPGYVDPEYHQCYQLTDKSDVYSFGVVLIELISSLPAVDISRQRNEINLANLAVDRIQRCALDELIDAKLGHDSDANIERMTTSVAELAFQCLQLDKDLRPTMDEVLDCLKQIQGVDVWRSGMQSPSPESENVILFKEKKLEESPVGVADKWMSSRSTTPNTSTNG